MTTDFYEEIQRGFELTLEHEDAPSWALGLKLGEECGEFSMDLLKVHGFLRHKKYTPELFEEAADIINVLIGVLSQRAKEMGIFAQGSPQPTVEEVAMNLTDLLKEAISRKIDKYKHVLTNTK